MTEKLPSPTRLRPGKLPGPLLNRLISAYATPDDADVVVPTGYGRDAAALQIGSEQLIVKSDPITFATDGAARYLVAVNANDIACMGGVPRWLTVVALLPEHTSTEASVEQMFADLQEACIASGISIIGGHTEITLGLDRPILVGTMIGVTGPTGLLRPGQAQAGDDLWISKWIGIEGTSLLAREHAAVLRPILGDDLVRSAAKLLRSPGISISKDAAVVLGSKQVNALHDPTEGGVATGIHEIAEASSLGAEVDASALPLLPETRIICDHYGIDPLGLLSSGALLIAAKPDGRRALLDAASEGGIPLTRIGRLVPADEGIKLIDRTDRRPLPRFDSDEITRVL
jgi:hydrogenase expression/formation protein HypE